jgi:hypothetical protein
LSAVVQSAVVTGKVQYSFITQHSCVVHVVPTHVGDGYLLLPPLHDMKDVLHCGFESQHSPTTPEIEKKERATGRREHLTRPARRTQHYLAPGVEGWK